MMKSGLLNKGISKLFEPMFFTAFWVLIFALPLFFQWINTDTINWRLIFFVWIDYLPLLIIFCVNRGVLIHRFLFKSRFSLYIISVTILITLTVLGSITIRQQLSTQKEQYTHKQTLLQFPDSNKVMQHRIPQRKNEPSASYPPYINLILLSILLVGFDTGMKLTVKWAQTQKQKAEIEKENIKHELAFLRNQISPHFLMNTLNNIHSLIDFDTIEAKRSVAKLSVLMRHLLYESDENPTPLAKEIQFIGSYVELMKLRFCDEVDIKFSIPENIPEIKIPPLLFTNILENAFKFGISYDNKSFVHIKLLIHKNVLEFNVINSVHKMPETSAKSGIGIENTKKRLKLLYNNNYQFTYTKDDNIFSSTIKIPI